jgi:2,3-dihydroxybiphenyl 1,2-dioxygenase
MQLGYLVFAVSDPARWADFLGTTLALPAGGPGAWRLDDACHRLIVQEGRDDDLHALGFDCGSTEGLGESVRRLRANGFAAEPGGAALRRARRVRELVLSRDPEGNTVELFWGLDRSDVPFSSALFADGLRVGEAGIGHAALVARRIEETERYYVLGLGFGVTERLATRAGPLAINGTFLHCNRRHHSVAMLDLPLAKRMHHFMLQTRRLADVGLALERTQAAGLSLSHALGQHPDPDGTFSFYAGTPSGFEFEIGYGSGEIEPAQWSTQRTTASSAWGHQPSVRLQMRLAAGMAKRWLRGGGLRPSTK